MNIRKLVALIVSLLMVAGMMVAPALAEEMKVECSESFSVEYLENGVKLIVDGNGRQILLVPEGQEAPEGYEGAVVVNGPVKTALFCSSTQVGMLAPYGDLRQWVSAVTTNYSPWAFEEMNEGIAEGTIIDVGSEMAPDYESIQELDPDIVFVYGGDYGQVDLMAKLDELGINYAVDNEYMESTLEARTEWTKFLAAFFDLDEQAVAFFDEQKSRFDEAAAKLEGVEPVKVAYANIWEGTVYVNGDNSWPGNCIKAAGGVSVFSDIVAEKGTTSLTLEEFYEGLQEADVWIYSSDTTYMPGKSALLELAPVVADAPVVVNGNVWQYDADFWSNTHLGIEQLLECAVVFHPELFPDYGELHHYHLMAE